MRGTGTIIILLSLVGTIRSVLGSSLSDASNFLNDITSTSTCSLCQSHDVPSAMTIVHNTEGMSIDMKFNSTFILAWENLTSAYVTQCYKSNSDVTGLGCTSEYQYVEKTQYSWTIYFTLHLEYDVDITTSAKQIAQSSFTSLETYNSYIANLGLNLKSKEVTCSSTAFPTKAPVTALPTPPPTKKLVTYAPTESPSKKPVTKKPHTKKPRTSSPAESPTENPVTYDPTESPTEKPHTPKPHTKKQVTYSPTESPTKSPVEANIEIPVTYDPTESPTKKPVTASVEIPVTYDPTESPTKKPVTASPGEKTVEVPVTYAPSASKATPAPTKTQTVEIPSSMTITSSVLMNFNVTFIFDWEQTTSAYYTLLYSQNSTTTDDSSVQCHTKYAGYEVVDETHYIIHYVLLVDVQYSSSSTYSKTLVTSTAKSAFSTQTKKVAYQTYLQEGTGYTITCKKVTYSKTSPTKAPASKNEASSSTGNPVSKTLITSTVEGSLNYTTSSVSKIVFSDNIINALEKATSTYITKYYYYNDNVQDLTVTAKYQGSTVLYECGCTTIVYFSFNVSYTTSTYSSKQIITQPFDTKLSRMAYTNILSKLGVKVELEGTSLDDTYTMSSARSSQITSAASKVVNTGLLTFIAAAIGSIMVLIA